MTLTYVNCIFCGHSCIASPNGAYCIECHAYAYQEDERSRWKVYVPSYRVPRQEVTDDGGDNCGQGCEYICRCFR